jgi:hypothetical protein
LTASRNDDDQQQREPGRAVIVQVAQVLDAFGVEVLGLVDHHNAPAPS